MGGRNWKATIALLAWVGATTVVGGLLLVRHLVALPTPDASDITLRDALHRDLPDPRWRAFHVMYRACPCSRKTIDHLLAEPRPSGVRELVLVVDDHGEAGPEDARLEAGGFQVEVITPDRLRTTYHLESAPVLVVMDPGGEVVYIGGYNRHKQSRAYEDLAIIDELRDAHSVAALPVFGCATSARLARILDPLELK